MTVVAPRSARAGEVLANPPVSMAVHLSELSAAFAGCTALDVGFGLSCRWATHLLCRNLGYGSGLGPYEFDGAMGIVTCLPEESLTAAPGAGYREIAYSGACTAANPVAVACESLARTTCLASGAGGSTGVIGANGQVIATFCTGQEVSSQETFSGIGQLQAACPQQTFCNEQAILTGNGCQSCGSRYCQSRGHSGGSDVEDFDGTTGRLTCLDGVSREQIRIKTCGATNARLCRATNDSPFTAQGMNVTHLTSVVEPSCLPCPGPHCDATCFRDLHDTFLPGVFDEEAVRQTLLKIRKDGYNTVRVFLDPAGQKVIVATGATTYGLGGPWAVSLTTHENGLYRPYMDNFMRFLAIAQGYSIYVVPILWYQPYNQQLSEPLYNPDTRPRDANGNVLVDWDNAFHLLPVWIEEKRQYASAFVGYIASRDPSLLSSLLSVELQNEEHVYVNKAPYSLSDGVVPTPAGNFNMFVKADRQQAVDANAVNWANTLTDAIHAVDPRLMVSLSTVTFDITGRSGPNGVLPGTGTNYFVPNSYPMRPAVLAYWSNLSYVDLHVYKSKFSTYNLDVDLASSEVPYIFGTPKPLLVGEFGAFRSWYDNDNNAAATDMRNLRDGLVQRGIAGWLYWSWNANQPDMFTALDGGEAINSALKP